MIPWAFPTTDCSFTPCWFEMHGGGAWFILSGPLAVWSQRAYFNLRSKSTIVLVKLEPNVLDPLG